MKGTGRAFLRKELAHESELWSEEDCAWWSKGKRSKKGYSTGNEGFQKDGFRSGQPEKDACNDFNPHKGRGKGKKGKGKEGAYPQSRFSASETPSQEEYGHSWESDHWYSSFTDGSSCLTTAWYGTGHAAWMASVSGSCPPSDARCS